MKRFIFSSSKLIFLAIFLLSKVSDVQSDELPVDSRDVSRDCSLLIVDEEGKPSKPLLKLLSATNIEHSGTFEDIVKATQQTQDNGGWLRATDKERWEVAEVHQGKRAQLMGIFEELGIMREVEPGCDNYCYAIIQGAAVHRVRSRLRHLARLWKKGIRFDSIVVLSGQRPLDKRLESTEALLDRNNTMFPFKPGWELVGELPTTEVGMAKLVFNQSPLPPEWQNIPIKFVDTPMQKTVSGKLRRPNTEDTIAQWLSEKPDPGSVLQISNQPYVYYQNTTFRLCTSGSSFPLNSAGQATSPRERISSLLDDMARWLHQEKKIRDRKEN